MVESYNHLQPTDAEITADNLKPMSHQKPLNPEPLRIGLHGP